MAASLRGFSVLGLSLLSHPTRPPYPPAGHGRWDRFAPKILHLIARPEELAGQLRLSLAGGWELENDCRIGSVQRFATSTDPRAVRPSPFCVPCVTPPLESPMVRRGCWRGLLCCVALPQVALRANPAALTLQNDGDEIISAATALHLKVCCALRPGMCGHE